MKQISSSKKLGETPIPGLLFAMSAPTVLSMLVQAMYNVVDSIFVSRISENALTALSIAFPVQTLVMAFSIGVSIGTSSLVSRRLGENNRGEAVNLARNGMFLALCLSLFWLFFGYPIAVGFSSLFAERGGEIYEYTRQYLFICVTFAFGSVFDMYFNKLMQSMGSMIVPMLTQLIGAVTNIILDPLLIFGIGALPALGVRGAAIATVTGQIAAMVFAASAFAVKKHELKFGPRGFRPDRRALWSIIKLGLPVTVLNSVSGVATTVMNGILISLSSAAVAVLGVYFKLQSFVFMPIFGLNQGALPVEAYNFGANDKKRFMQTYGLCIFTALAVMVAGTALFQALPVKLLALFEASGDMLEIGVRALRIVSLSFIPAAFAVTTINMFQALGHGWKSMLMSILRQLGFLLPLAIIFAETSGLDSVWLSYPIAEVATIVIFAPVAMRAVRSAFAKHSAAASAEPPFSE